MNPNLVQSVERTNRILRFLRCPHCKGCNLSYELNDYDTIDKESASIKCLDCLSRYHVVRGVPIFESQRDPLADLSVNILKTWRRKFHTIFRIILGIPYWFIFIAVFSIRERVNFFLPNNNSMDLLPDEVNDWQKAQARWVLNVPHNLYLKSIEIALFRNFSSSTPRLEIGGAGGDTTNLAFNNQIIDLDLEYFSQSIFDQHDAGGDIFLATNAHICGGTYNMPLADESFQSVQMVHILDHLTDVNITFSELSRVLRPGGKLIVTTYSASVFRHLWLFRIIRKINTRWADIYYQLRTRATGLINGDPKDATGQNLLTIAEWKNIGWSYGLNLIHTQPFNYGAIWTNMLDLQKRGDPRFFRKILISIVGYAVNKELVKRGVMLEEDAANIFMVFEKPAAL